MKLHSSETGILPAGRFQAQFSISDQEFVALSQLIYRLIGIQLNEQKKMMVISRLSKRLHQLNLNSFSQYLNYLEQSTEKEDELTTLINRITTNKTDFFREIHHFEFLQNKYLPQIAAKKIQNLRIWSAGCSSGEEPYTIAMVLDDFLQKNQHYRAALDVRILASDVDTNVLAKARTGIYGPETISPIPAHFRAAYLQKAEHNYRVCPELQQVIAFRRFNLMHDFPFKYGFDLIFCRNVLIYFSQEDRIKIIKKFHACLRAGGYLILGHSESLLAENCGFQSIGNTIYLKT